MNYHRGNILALDLLAALEELHARKAAEARQDAERLVSVRPKSEGRRPAYKPQRMTPADGRVANRSPRPRDED